MNWIVLWTVTIVVQGPCAQKPDPYTGELPTIQYAVLCLKEEEKEMRREFQTKEEAEAFIKEGPKDIKFTLRELDIRDWKAD